MVHLYRRRGGVEGIYSCEIPDSMNVIQTIYIAKGQPGHDPPKILPVYNRVCVATAASTTGMYE